MSIRTNLVAASLMVMVSAAPVLAADHLMKVGEVMLANAGGSTAVQFIELEDPGETFPSAPYVVEIYGAAGGSPLITYATTISGLTTRYMLATSQARTDFGFTTGTLLTMALPTNGQACFRRNGGTPDTIHCFSWGTITTAVTGTFGTNTGASPPNGMSVQRVGGTYVVAAPTPNAANSNGMVDMPMVDGPPAPDAGVTPDASGTPDAPGGNPNTPDDDDGCSVGAGASWFGLAMFAMLLLVVRRSSTRRR